MTMPPNPALAGELLAVVCPVPVPDGVRGMCWRPRPCPDHEDLTDGQLVGEQVDAAAERLLRLDRRYALAIGIGPVCGLGYAAGRLARPWAQLVPDAVVWTLAGGLVVTAVAVAGAVGLWRWWRDWWPYRHNRVLGTATGLGWETPTGVGVRDGR